MEIPENEGMPNLTVRRSGFSLLGIASAALFFFSGLAPAFAGPEPLPGDGKVVLPTETAYDPIRPWWGLEITGGDGAGTDDGLLTLESFIPIFQDPRNLVFTFSRTVLSHDFDDTDTILANNQEVTTDSTCPECNPIPVNSVFRNHDIFRHRDDVLLSGSVGGGYRYYSPNMDRIFGVNAFYDYRDTGRAEFHQVGLGVETLGHWFDFRANGYIVVGDDAHVLGNRVDPVFYQEHIDLEHTFFFEHALSGADSEVGVPIIRNWGLKGYVGGYYYTGPGEGDGFVGVKGRLEERVTDDFDFGVTVSHDDKFGTTAMASVAIRFGPGGSSRKGAARDVIPARRADRIQRSQQIWVHDGMEVRHALAIDPATGAPIDVVHVDSNAPGGGNGTVDHPYQTLGEAQAGSDPNDIIFAHGSSIFNGQSIVLQDSQRFLGEGVIHLFQSTHGTFILPGRIGVPRPEIFGPDNTTVVTMANNNEVRNFFIQAANGTAAAPNGSTGISAVGVTGGLVRDVTVIAGNGANGAAGVNGGNGGIAIVVNGSTLTLCDSDVTGGNGGAGGNVTGAVAVGLNGGDGGNGGAATGAGGIIVGGGGGDGGGGQSVTGGVGLGANGGAGGDAVQVTVGSVFVASNVTFNGGNGGAGGIGTGGAAFGGNGGGGGNGGSATDTIDSTALTTTFASTVVGGDGGAGGGGGDATGGAGVGGLGGAGGAGLTLSTSQATFCDNIVFNGGAGGAGGAGVGGVGVGGNGGAGGAGGNGTGNYTVTVTENTVGAVTFTVTEAGEAIVGGNGGGSAGGGLGIGGVGVGETGGAGGAGFVSTGSVVDATNASVISTGGAGGVGGAGIGGAGVGGAGGMGGAGGQGTQNLAISSDITTTLAIPVTEGIALAPIIVGGNQGAGAGGNAGVGATAVGGIGGAGGAGVAATASVADFATLVVFGGVGGIGGDATGGAGIGGAGGSAAPGAGSAGNAANNVNINVTDTFDIVFGTATIADGPTVVGGLGGAGAAGSSGIGGVASSGGGGAGGSGFESNGSVVSATSISATGGNGGDAGAALGGVGVGGQGGVGGRGGRADDVTVEVPTFNFIIAADLRTNTSGQTVVGGTGGGGGQGGDADGGTALGGTGGAGGAAVASAGSVVTFGDAALIGGNGGNGGLVRAGDATGGNGGNGGAGGNGRSRFREDLNATLNIAALAITDSFTETVVGGTGGGGSGGGTALGGSAAGGSGGSGGAALLTTGSVIDFTGSSIALTAGNGGSGGDSFGGSAQGGAGGNGGDGGDGIRIQRLSYSASGATAIFAVTETDGSLIVGGSGAGGGVGGSGLSGPAAGGLGGLGGNGIDATGSVVTIAASTVTGGNGGFGGNGTGGDAFGGDGGNGGTGGTATFQANIDYTVTITPPAVVAVSDSDLPTVVGGNGAAGGAGGAAIGGPASGGLGSLGGFGVSSNASIVTLTDSAIFGGMGGDAGNGNGGSATGGNGGVGGGGGAVITSFVINTPGTSTFAPISAFGNAGPGGDGGAAIGGPASGGSGGNGGDGTVSIAGGLIVLNGVSSTTGGDAGNGGDGNGGNAFGGNGGNGGDGNGGVPGPGGAGGIVVGGPAVGGSGGTGGAPGGSNGTTGVGTAGIAIAGIPGNVGGP